VSVNVFMRSRRVNESFAAINELAIGPNFWHFRNRQSKKLQFTQNRSVRVSSCPRLAERADERNKHI
jgi:hypothetical protein